MDIVLALAASLVFAFGTVLLQKAGMAEPAGGSATGLLLRMAQRPVWLAGIAAEAVGVVLQAIALAIGRLAVVQPLLVSTPSATSSERTVMHGGPCGAIF